MTEMNTPIGGLAVAEPQTAVLPVGSDDDGAPDNRRKLAVVGAAAGVVVLLIAAFFLLKGGGSDTTTDPAAPTAAAPAPAQAAPQAGQGGQATKASPDKPIALPKPYAGPIGRDPFKALYVAPAAAKPEAGPAASAGSPSASDNVPAVTVPGTTTGTTSPDTSTGGVVPDTAAESAFAPVWIELLKVHAKTATFVVGYSDGHHAKTQTFRKVTAPTDGLRTTFAGVFALLSIQSGTVTVQFGDGTPFDLNKGFGDRHFVG